MSRRLLQFRLSSRWQRPFSWGYPDVVGGFFGALYQRDAFAVIAIRGTSEKWDALDDSFMAPKCISRAQADTVARNLLSEYCRDPKHPGVNYMVNRIKGIICHPMTQAVTAFAGNQVPPAQIREAHQLVEAALRWCSSNGAILRAFTGHSLRGAIAQYLAENTGDGGRLARAHNRSRRGLQFHLTWGRWQAPAGVRVAEC